MGSLFYLTLVVLSFVCAVLTKTEARKIQSARLLDLLFRDITFKAYDTRIKTETLPTVNLPANFSGIFVDTARFRCGSLRRYGAQIKEFHLCTGVSVHPCAERVMVVRQNLGSNWSAIYYANYNLSGYQIVSPSLGLLAYNAGTDVNFSPFELGIEAGEKAISIDFKTITRMSNELGMRPLCASFEVDGKMTLARETKPYICAAKKIISKYKNLEYIENFMCQ